MVKTVSATRYLTPLREGGSLPAIVEANDGEMYVMKFAGAGQGVKALIAELVAGELAREVGLPMPELAFITLDESLGPSEPDTEIHDLLQASVGLNLGLRYLPKAFSYNLLLQPAPDPDLASAIVWFDAYVTNMDRTPQNVNLLIWKGGLWLIDHGSALYFHHNMNNLTNRHLKPFPYIENHTLLSFATALWVQDDLLRRRLTDQAIERIVDLIPGAWLGGEPAFEHITDHRRVYSDYLINRRDASHVFVEEAENARTKRL
jgi:hypothetical protein